jgi:ectoine hydroxylase
MRPRLDRVVYGENPGPLSREEVAAYDANGFLERLALFDAGEVAGLAARCREIAAARRRDPAPEVIREPGGDEVRSVFAAHRDDPVFARLAADPRLVGIAEQLLGSPVYVHQSRINLKPGFTGKEFYWHSDFETWHVEDGMPRMRALSISLSLTENNEHNGPLMVVPGSHRVFVACAGRTPERHFEKSLRKQEYGVPEPDQIAALVREGGIRSHKGPPGSIVAFDCNLMHGSGANITPFPRNNVFFVYNSVENALRSPFGGIAPRPDYIASREPPPVSSA